MVCKSWRASTLDTYRKQVQVVWVQLCGHKHEVKLLGIRMVKLFGIRGKVAWYTYGKVVWYTCGKVAWYTYGKVVWYTYGIYYAEGFHL